MKITKDVLLGTLFMDIVTVTDYSELPGEGGYREAFIYYNKEDRDAEFLTNDMYVSKGSVHPSFCKIGMFALARVVEEDGFLTPRVFSFYSKDSEMLLGKMSDALKKARHLGALNITKTLKHMRTSMAKVGRLDLLPHRFDDRGKKPWEITELGKTINTISISDWVAGSAGFHMSIEALGLQSGVEMPKNIIDIQTYDFNKAIHSGEEEKVKKAAGLLNDRLALAVVSFISQVQEKAGKTRKVFIDLDTIEPKQNGKHSKEKEIQDTGKDAPSVAPDESNNKSHGEVNSNSGQSILDSSQNILETIRNAQEITPEQAASLRGLIAENKEYEDEIIQVVHAAMCMAYDKKGEVEAKLEIIKEAIYEA